MSFLLLLLSLYLHSSVSYSLRTWLMRDAVAHAAAGQNLQVASQTRSWWPEGHLPTPPEPLCYPLPFSTSSSSFTVTSRAGREKKKKKPCPFPEMKSAAFPQEQRSGSHRCSGAFRCYDGRRWRLMPLRSQECTALKQKASVVKVKNTSPRWRQAKFFFPRFATLFVGWLESSLTELRRHGHTLKIHPTDYYDCTGWSCDEEYTVNCS